VRTGLAIPKKITAPFPPKRVETASGGASTKPASLGRSQLLATQMLPAGSTSRSVTICRPPMKPVEADALHELPSGSS
jgi:hypothetical protein